jgi:hypothetical protein
LDQHAFASTKVVGDKDRQQLAGGLVWSWFVCHFFSPVG